MYFVFCIFTESSHKVSCMSPSLKFLQESRSGTDGASGHFSMIAISALRSFSDLM